MPSSCTPETGSPSVPTLSLLLQSLAATTLLSAFLSLIYLIPHTTKVMSLFCAWLLLLSTMPSTFGHAFIHGISPPFSRLHNIPQTIFSVICSYIATQAHATATVNSPAVNTGCRDPIPNFIVLKFSGSQSNFFFNFLRTLHTVFYNSIYLPINCAQTSVSSPTLGICCGLSPSGLVPLWLRGGRNSKKAVGRGGSE